jgi:MFS family permease
VIRRLTQGLAPLRHRGYRRLAGGQLASAVGDSCYAIALPWYVLATHGGTLLLGTVLAAYGIPRTVALVFGGHAADRWRPWTVMMTSDAVRVLAVAAMAVAAATGPARAIILVPMAVVLGAGEGFFLPGSFSVIPELLPAEDLLAGNALSSAGNQVAMLAGPAIGGVLVAFLGPAPAFAFDAVTFLISAATLAGVRSAQRAPRPARAQSGAGEARAVDDRAAEAGAAEAGAADPGAGVLGAGVLGAGAGAASAGADAATVTGPAVPTLGTMLRSERVLQVVLLVVLAANLGMGGEGEVALPALAHGPLHAGAGGYGGLVAAFAAGALVGTLAASQIRGGRRPAILGSVAFLAESVCLAAVPFLGGLLPDGAALLAVGAMNGLGNVMMITLFQRWAPPALLGRLMGLVMLAAFGTFPVSVALGAVLVHAIGPAPFFPIAGAITAAAVLVGLSQRSWRNLGADPAPARTATTAATPATGS